jgi:1-acyl-sn-glycerol-3-phosphate acyltransferase
MMRRVFYFVFFTFVNIFMRFKKSGLENNPKTGPGIIVFNHIGRLEIVLIMITTKRHDLVGWMAEKYKGLWYAEYVLKVMDSKLVDRFNPDLEAIRWAQKHLRNGGVMGISPEGTRSPDFSLREGKQGVAFLASRTGVPIIPAGVTFEKGAVKDAFKLKFPRASIKYGKPFYLQKAKRENRREALEKGTEEIMCQIAALLPQSFRGIYADNPRTKELLDLQSDQTE